MIWAFLFLVILVLGTVSVSSSSAVISLGCIIGLFLIYYGLELYTNEGN